MVFQEAPDVGYRTNDQDQNGGWSGIVDISRSPTPTPPAKRVKLSSDRPVQQFGFDSHHGASPEGITNLPRASKTPRSLGYGAISSFPTLFSNGTMEHAIAKPRMQTGCIPCLMKGIPCDPKNPGCKMAMSDDWQLNLEEDGDDSTLTFESSSLTLFRPDTKWRRNWRERHSLNFFVNFSAPQMAGFFDSTFWQRMVIQTSYHEPAILHAITAIGALHECILQRAFADEKRKARAIEFALNQCNKAIACLTSAQASSSAIESGTISRRAPNSKLALITCVLFTCFEAMQGRCDSAVNHALQGRRLLQATGRTIASTTIVSEEDDVDQMRPIVERLEVQATALLDKGRRPEIDATDPVRSLPSTDFVYSLDHAHNTLHMALNSVMRFMQGFNPTAPRDHIAVTMAEKYLRYAPWFTKWEASFTSYLSESREFMSNMDLKRAMVLKANHLVGTMLASVDQSAGPVAYDAYESEFRAIVDLAREVLSSFSCPPLPTLTGGSSGTPYLSFSLWVTDPLWMAISRCRNPSIRQAAFTLLSQNPRQEGIWHAGPQLSNNKFMRRVEAGPSVLKDTIKSDQPPNGRNGRSTAAAQNGRSSSRRAEADAGTSPSTDFGSLYSVDPPAEVVKAAPASKMRIRGEWIDLRAKISQQVEGEQVPED